MTSRTAQKSEARNQIVRLVDEYLMFNPAMARHTAVSFCKRLSGYLTLAELQEWKQQIEEQVPR